MGKKKNPANLDINLELHSPKVYELSHFELLLFVQTNSFSLQNHVMFDTTSIWHFLLLGAFI